jgi:hypothetical protein
VHRDTQRPTPLTDWSESFALVQVLRGITHMNIGAHRFDGAAETDEKFVEQEATDTTAAALRGHRDTELR